MQLAKEELAKGVARNAPELVDQAGILAELLTRMLSTEQPNATGFSPDEQHALGALVSQLAGRQFATPEAIVSFGQDNQLGDVTIRDVIGGNSMQISIQLPPAQPAAAQSARAKAYQELFERVNEAYITMRQLRLSDAEFSARLKEINLLILRNALLIQQEDHVLVYRLLKAIRYANELIAKLDDTAIAEAWAITAPLPSFFSHDAIGKAIRNVGSIHAIWLQRAHEEIGPV